MNAPFAFSEPVERKLDALAEQLRQMRIGCFENIINSAMHQTAELKGHVPDRPFYDIPREMEVQTALARIMLAVDHLTGRRVPDEDTPNTAKAWREQVAVLLDHESLCRYLEPMEPLWVLKEEPCRTELRQLYKQLDDQAKKDQPQSPRLPDRGQGGWSDSFRIGGV